MYHGENNVYHGQDKMYHGQDTRQDILGSGNMYDGQDMMYYSGEEDGGWGWRKAISHLSDRAKSHLWHHGVAETPGCPPYRCAGLVPL